MAHDNKGLIEDRKCHESQIVLELHELLVLLFLLFEAYLETILGNLIDSWK